jgi:hypothetical protein
MRKLGLRCGRGVLVALRNGAPTFPVSTTDEREVQSKEGGNWLLVLFFSYVLPVVQYAKPSIQSDFSNFHFPKNRP